MESKFYTRATGRFKAATSRSFDNKNYSSKRSQGSLYSIDDETLDSKQYPLGTLTESQERFIYDYLRAMCIEPEIDSSSRSIHWVGLWRVEEEDITVTCSMMQPNISTCSINLSNVTYSNAREFSNEIFPETSGIRPDINKNPSYCQLMGRYSIVFADKMIEQGMISRSQARHNNVVLTNTQLVFCIIQDNKCYECILTHLACKVVMDLCGDICNITPKTSTGHNYAFRSPKIRTGKGTGPSLTVHSSGTMQYQGNPEHIFTVVSCFKQCIERTMSSNMVMRFLRSLSSVREFPIA